MLRTLLVTVLAMVLIVLVLTSRQAQVQLVDCPLGRRPSENASYAYLIY